MSWDSRLFESRLATRRFGREFMWLDEVDSTNRWLFENAGRFTTSGGTVAADHQTHGQGRQGRTWHDRRGSCLLFSVIFRDPNANSAQGFLGLLPAIALAELLAARLPEHHRIGLKWPNDVTLNGRKLSGVLGQAAAQSGRSVAVVGMGVNVGVRAQELPTELRGSATSLLIETGEVFSRETLLADLLGAWERLYDDYLAGRTDDLLDCWLQWGPPRGSRLTVSEGEKSVTGRFEGLGEQGQLLMRDDEGRLRTFFSGDVTP